jgi:hypothetical protein
LKIIWSTMIFYKLKNSNNQERIKQLYMEQNHTIMVNHHLSRVVRILDKFHCKRIRISICCHRDWKSIKIYIINMILEITILYSLLKIKTIFKMNNLKRFKNYSILIHKINNYSKIKFNNKNLWKRDILTDWGKSLDLIKNKIIQTKN